MTALEELPAKVDALGSQIAQLRAEIYAEFSATREGLRSEIRAGDEETRTFMRMLHEEVMTRLALIQEGRRPRKRR